MIATFKANLFALILIVIQFFGSIFVTPLLATIIPSYLGLLTFAQLLFLLAPVVVYFAVTGDNAKEVLSLRNLSFRNICFVVLIALSAQPVAWFLSYLTGLFFNNDVSDLFVNIGMYPYWMLLIVLAVIPAICEEFAIRGVVLHGYKKEPVLVAAVITGLIFGMLHLNPQQLLYASVLGMLFGYLVRITNSIFSGVIAHFIFNGFQVTISKFSLNNGEIEKLSTSSASRAVTTMTTLGTIAVVFSFIIVYLLKRLKVTEYNVNIESVSSINEEEDFRNDLFNLPLIVLIIVFVGIMFITYK